MLKYLLLVEYHIIQKDKAYSQVYWYKQIIAVTSTDH